MQELHQAQHYSDDKLLLARFSEDIRNKLDGSDHQQSNNDAKPAKHRRRWRTFIIWFGVLLIGIFSVMAISLEMSYRDHHKQTTIIRELKLKLQDLTLHNKSLNQTENYTLLPKYINNLDRLIPQVQKLVSGYCLGINAIQSQPMSWQLPRNKQQLSQRWLQANQKLWSYGHAYYIRLRAEIFNTIAVSALMSIESFCKQANVELHSTIPQYVGSKIGNLLKQAGAQLRLYRPQASQHAHQGLHYIGEYFWRIHRIFLYIGWLKQHKLCSEQLLNLRKQWGFQLQITTQQPVANIFVNLWPDRYEPSKQRLKDIRKYPIGQADGQVLWLPALPKPLIQLLPRSYIWLILLSNSQNNQRAFLPLLPETGGQLKIDLPMRDIEIYNDGSRVLRFPSFSNDGNWLSFVTYKLQHDENLPQFDAPHCWSTHRPLSSTDTWRSAISIYAIDRRGWPHSGVHQQIRSTIHFMQFDPDTKQHSLFVASVSSPDNISQTPEKSKLDSYDPNVTEHGEFSPPPHQPTSSGNVSLWKIPLLLNSKSIFDKPQQITNGGTQTVDLPLCSLNNQLKVLRLSCDLPSALKIYQPQNQLWKIMTPKGYRLLHAAGSPRHIALLLQHRSNRRAALALYPLTRHRQTKPNKIIQLSAVFKQIRMSNNVWLLAGADLNQPLDIRDNKKLLFRLEPMPYVRYLDPAIHQNTRRLFVIEQWQILGSTERREHRAMATFLVSRPIPKY